jgi:ABC-type sugar transport system permease subunit
MRFTNLSAGMFVLPAALLFGVFAIYPTLSGLAMSFTDAQGVVGGHFVGAANYLRLSHDSNFKDSLRNTLAFAGVIVTVQNLIGLAVASWMRNQPALRDVVRAGLLLPCMMAFLVVGYVWSYIYSPLGGPLNSLLAFAHLAGFQQVWLGDGRFALLAIAASSIWMYMGYTATIYLSGYLGIATDVSEAALIDGARGWTRFRYIDWPLLAPALTVSVTLSTLGTLKIFELPLIMTGGGPAGATETLSSFVYQISFRTFEFGYGTAISLVLLAVTVVAAVIVTGLLRRREVPA